MAAPSGAAVTAQYSEWVGDSQFCSNGSPNNPTFILNSVLSNVIAFRVLEVAIPFTYYTVNPTNNTFWLYGNNATLVTLPVGNYTAATFPTILQAALNGAADGVFALPTISTITAKLTLSSTVPFYLGFNVNPVLDVYNQGSNDPRIIMGFNNGFSSTAKASTVVSPNVARFSGPDYVYICSSKLGILNRETFRDNYLNDFGPYLAKIPVTVNPGGLITWAEPDPMHFYYTHDTKIDAIDMYLTLGSSSSVLDLNGAPFQVRVGFIQNTESVAVAKPNSTGRVLK